MGEVDKKNIFDESTAIEIVKSSKMAEKLIEKHSQSKSKSKYEYELTIKELNQKDTKKWMQRNLQPIKGNLPNKLWMAELEMPEIERLILIINPLTGEIIYDESEDLKKKIFREIFQILINNKLKPMKKLAEVAEKSPVKEISNKVVYYEKGSSFYNVIKDFCKKYHCSEQIQILNWNLLGLYSFFTLTDDPTEHPYMVRQYKIISNTGYLYLSQYVTPSLDRIRQKFPKIYPIKRIYPPSNNIRMLYEETRQLTYIDKWLLNLKEVMVDQEMGEILYQPDESLKKPFVVSKKFLKGLSNIYIRDKVGRFSTKAGTKSRNIIFIKKLEGFLSTYLDIKTPNMGDYILILDKVEKPKLFLGGFIGQFPLLELYESESPNALICRFQIPELNAPKFHLSLLRHLISVCYPSLWILEDDKRIFRLQEQWGENGWISF